MGQYNSNVAMNNQQKCLDICESIPYDLGVPIIWGFSLTRIYCEIYDSILGWNVNYRNGEHFYHITEMRIMGFIIYGFSNIVMDPYCVIFTRHDMQVFHSIS